jgi:glycosyltransferase involved in cell wall biosynthesis
MRIIFYLQELNEWKSGIWYHRQETPCRALAKRGHSTKQVVMGDRIPDEFMEFPNSVVMGRVYPDHTNPIKVMSDYRKQGKRVIYDIDDDYWTVDPDNPSKNVSNALKDQYEGLIREADALTTPSKVIAAKLKKLTKKPIFFCPNGIDTDDYKERPHEHDRLIIGYMGAASHWKDLSLIVEVLEKLRKKYDFIFVLYGMTGEPLEAAMYAYNRILSNGSLPEQNEYFKSALNFYDKLRTLEMYHVPFYPPELHPMSLSKADFDIGLAPLEDNEFNRGKSCIKFYEYATVGTATVASDVLPYKDEVDYRAKNTFKDWYNKIEKLIVDKKFREELAKKQQKWVLENRSLTQVGLAWEMALQKQEGLKVSNQSGWKKMFGL